MKKSALAVLIISIILLIAGLVMIGCGVADVHHAYYHHDGGFYYYSYRYTYNLLPAEGNALAHFGHAVFNSGLVMMVIFAILQVHDRKDKTLKEKEHKANMADAEKAKAEAEDAKAETIDPGTGKETKAPQGN